MVKMEERNKIIEKIKTYLEEKLELDIEERYIITSIMAKDYLEEITEEDIDLDDELGDIDDEDLENTEEKELEDEQENTTDDDEDDTDVREYDQEKEKIVIKKPKLKIKGEKDGNEQET